MNQSNQSNLELLPPVAFAAGETKVFYLSGSYFELIDCPSAVDVLLTDRNGGTRARMIGAGQTHHVKNTDYDVIFITSAAAQTIRFAYGSGEAGTRNTSGSVTLLNAVTLDAATLAALGSTDINPASLATMRQPLAATGNFKSSGALAATTPETIFTPAANVNGAILLSAGFNIIGNATLTAPSVLAKASAPTTNIDGEVIFGATYSAINGTTYIDTGQLSQPQFIAAGLGLYYIQASAGLTGSRFARYRLL